MSNRPELAPGTLVVLRKGRQVTPQLRINAHTYVFSINQLRTNKTVTEPAGAHGIIVAQLGELSRDFRLPCYVLFPENVGWVVVYTEEELRNTRNPCCMTPLEAVT